MKIKCKHCENLVEICNKHATVVICDECRIKRNQQLPQTAKRNYDTDFFIYCRICNAARKKLDIHIKKEHNLTIKEYKQKFPDAPIYSKNTINKKRNRSKESLKKTSEALKKSWKNEEVRKRRKETHVNPMKGKKHTIEAKLKIAKASDYRKSVKGFRRDIGRSVRSTIEANMCRMLDYCGIIYDYEEKHFSLSDKTLLMMDFYLYEDFEFIKKGHLELKGWKKDNGYYSNKEKFDKLKKEKPKEFNKITFLFGNSEDWKILEKKYKNKIPMWETQKHNLKTHPEIYSQDRINDKENWDEYLICPLCLREGKGIINSRQKFIGYKHLLNHGYKNGMQENHM